MCNVIIEFICSLSASVYFDLEMFFLNNSIELYSNQTISIYSLPIVLTLYIFVISLNR